MKSAGEVGAINRLTEHRVALIVHVKKTLGYEKLRNIRILFVTTEEPSTFSGGSVYLRNIASELDRKGLSVSVFPISVKVATKKKSKL